MSDELWGSPPSRPCRGSGNARSRRLSWSKPPPRHIAEVEPAVDALRTLCLDRARDHAGRIMQGGAACEAAGEAGWLAGLPVSIKDLTDVAGVRSTYGSPLFADHVPSQVSPSGRADRAQGRHRDRQIEYAGIRSRRQHLQRGLRQNAQSLEHRADLGRLDRGRRGIVSDRRGRAGARHRPRRLLCVGPGGHCSVVGLRPSPGRVTRGTVNNLLGARSRCRVRWRAALPTWRFSSTRWRASARTIR